MENIKEVLVGCSEGIRVNADNKEKIQIWDRMRNVVATAVSMEPVIRKMRRKIRITYRQK